MLYANFRILIIAFSSKCKARYWSPTKIDELIEVVRVGDYLELQCPSTIRPTCSKGGKKIPDSRIQDSYSIIIESASLTDQGFYRCEGQFDMQTPLLCKRTVYVAGK